MPEEKDIKENKEEVKIDSSEKQNNVSAEDSEKKVVLENKIERSGFKKNRRVSKRRSPKQRSEFNQRILDIRRVTRVSSGGRRFSFAVSLVAGNGKGKIGVGTGKAGDTSAAIEKAFKDAQKNSILINLTNKMSIPHEVEAKYNSARVVIMPAPGRGVIAGSALRDVLELTGMNDVNAKIFSGSKNKLNIARASIKALSLLKKTSIKSKDKKMDEIVHKKNSESNSRKKFYKKENKSDTK